MNILLVEEDRIVYCRHCKRQKFPAEVFGPYGWSVWQPVCPHGRFYLCTFCDDERCNGPHCELCPEPDIKCDCPTCGCTEFYT
jgi:hypothetical protein